MAGKPGFTFSLYPIPDALEDAGAAYNVLARKHASRGEWEMATAYKRTSKAFWASAQTIREEQQKKSDTPHEQDAA